MFFKRSINPQYKKINRYMIIIQGQIWIYMSNFVIQNLIKSLTNVEIPPYNKVPIPTYNKVPIPSYNNVPINVKNLGEYKPYEN